MYIRTTSRKNKDGSKVQYLQLAHNERHPINGQSQAKVLFNFGRTDEVNKEKLRGLAQSIGRLLGDEPVIKGAQPAGAPLKLISSKSMGGAWLLDSLWKKLKIDEALSRNVADCRFASPVERTIFAMVANRSLDPSSKLATEDWVAHDVVIPGLPAFDVQQGYRAMDFLIESDEAIQREVFHSVDDLLNLEVDLLFFDTTSTYFETEETDEESLRQRGYSKDHRPDLPQVVIGFAVTRDGISIRCWVWLGNTADMSVVPEVKKDLIGWKLGRVISVADRGIFPPKPTYASSSNPAAITSSVRKCLPASRRSKPRLLIRDGSRLCAITWRSKT